MDQTTEKIDFSYTTWRIGFMRVILTVGSIFGLPAVLASVLGHAFTIYDALYIGVYLGLLLVTILPVPYSIRAGVLIALTFGLGIAGLIETGIWGDARVFMLCAIILAALLFSWKAGWLMTGLTMLSYLIAGWLILTGRLVITSGQVTPGNIGNWTSGSAGVLLFAILLINGIRLTQIEFEKSQARAQLSLDLLRDERNNLEQRVNERTAELQARSQDLAQQSQQLIQQSELLQQQSQELEVAHARSERRARQFEAIAEISRSIAEIKKLDILLPTVTQVVSEKLDFYHNGIFLIDEARQFAVLAATNSPGGQRMLERGHRLKIGETGIVGNVAVTGVPRIAVDTGKEAIHFKNPDLPDTHSEMALPLTSGKEIIGVLDVQSTERDAFTQDDVAIIGTLAAQISIAIQNARLFETTQKSLADAEALYRQFIQKEWTSLSQRQKVTGFRYNALGIAPVEAIDTAAAAVVAEQKVFVDQSEKGSTIAVPIALRGEVIGILDVQAAGGHAWSQDEIDIVQAIADRVAISAENARLFEQTAERAERERKVSEITSKIRSTNNPDEMVQIAMQEIKQALKVKNVRVVPYTPPQSSDQG